MRKINKDKSKKNQKVFKEKDLKKNMKKLREIKKYSGVWVIKLNPIDIKDYELNEGDFVDISDILKNEVKN